MGTLEKVDFILFILVAAFSVGAIINGVLAVYFHNKNHIYAYAFTDMGSCFSILSLLVFIPAVIVSIFI